MMANNVFAIGDQSWPGLSKLTEECGEVLQIVGKLMATHGNPDHWSGDLRKMLVDELGDLFAAVMFVAWNCLTNDEKVAFYLRSETKYARFGEWHRAPTYGPAAQHGDVA